MRALPEAGDLVAGYRVERQLGRGGMGVVYLAEQVRLRRRIALKVITPELAEDEQFRQRFERESQLAASLDHPNVIPVYEAGEADGVLFISMKYVEGRDLRAIIRAEGKLAPPRAGRIVAEVAAALDAAHARGLVHRDVKPANILVSDEAGERAYLTDFGLTKHMSSVSGLTHTGQWVGTLDYVAPEQLAGGPLDARVDVYSLGCVFFECLSGQVPYLRDSDVAKLYAHLNDRPPTVSALAPGVPPECDAVIDRALAKQPGDRFPSAGDLGLAVEAAVQGAHATAPERTVARGDAALRPDEERTPEPDVVERRPARRRLRRPALAVGAAALALGAVAAVLVVTGSGGGGGASKGGNACAIKQTRSKDDRRPAIINFVNATQKPVAIYWLDYEGNRKRYTTIPPGMSYEQSTYRTHIWMALDKAGNCLGYTVADKRSKTYTIGG